MSRFVRVPTARSERDRHDRDIYELQRRMRGETGEREVKESIPFSFAGALATSTSPPWVPWVGRTLIEVVALLGTAGSSSTVVTVYKNAVSIGTVTLVSSDTIEAASFATSFAQSTDKLTVGITTVGTGAADLTVIGRLA